MPDAESLIDVHCQPTNRVGNVTRPYGTEYLTGRSARLVGVAVVNHRPQVRRAVTLVEAVLASVILAISVGAIAQAVIAGQMQTYVAMQSRRGVELAEALADEVLRLPYEDPNGPSAPGPEAGESSRSSFDNADDYHGFSESAGAVAGPAGTVYPSSYRDFSRSVTAAYGSVSVTGFADAVPGLTVTVTVQDSAGITWSVTRFIAQPPS